MRRRPAFTESEKTERHRRDQVRVCELNVLEQRYCVVLEVVGVEDDGAGFETATARERAGLTNMNDRVDALGGKVPDLSPRCWHHRVRRVACPGTRRGSDPVIA